MIFFHIAGALLTFTYAGYALIRKTAQIHHITFSIKALTALTIVQVVSGVAVAVQSSASLVTTCVQLVLYVAYIVAVQAVLYMRVRALSDQTSEPEVA